MRQLVGPDGTVPAYQTEKQHTAVTISTVSKSPKARVQCLVAAAKAATAPPLRRAYRLICHYELIDGPESVLEMFRV